MTHVDTPPPPPVASTYTPPPPLAVQPPAKSTVGRTIALWVLFVFLVLIVLPIMALRVLGTQIESESVAAYPLESVAVPGDATPYLAPDSRFTMATNPSWDAPAIEPNPITGRDTVFWMMPQYATTEFISNVNVSSVVVPSTTTLQMLSNAELENARSQLDGLSNVQARTRNLDGVLVREFSFTASLQGIDLAWYAVIHKEGEMVHMATVTAPAEFADQVRADSEAYLLTVRSLN